MKAREDVIHPLVNGRTLGRVEDTPLLPQLRGAKKVGENVETRDGRSGRLGVVSEWNGNHQTRTARRYRLHTTLNIGFIAGFGSIRSLGG